MCDAIKILCGGFAESTFEEKNKAAAHIINKYNLPLTIDEILDTFRIAGIRSSCNSQVIFFNLLLNNNKNMFIAIVLARNDNLVRHCIVNSNSSTGYGYNLGKFDFLSSRDIISKYQVLLNYYDFDIDIDIIQIPKNCKLELQEYRDEKYGGKLTKPVN